MKRISCDFQRTFIRQPSTVGQKMNVQLWKVQGDS